MAGNIEYNLFNWNRHSIAGTGRPGNSYVARHNVELGVSLSHCFDMHGGRDRGDGTDTAGTLIEIYNNTFRASQTPVVIRGVPEKRCEVHHNWFLKHDHVNPQEAVQIAADINAKITIPIHWGCFLLSDEHPLQPPIDLKLALKGEKTPAFWLMKGGEAFFAE